MVLELLHHSLELECVCAVIVVRDDSQYVTWILLAPWLSLKPTTHDSKHRGGNKTNPANAE